MGAAELVLSRKETGQANGEDVFHCKLTIDCWRKKACFSVCPAGHAQAPAFSYFPSLVASSIAQWLIPWFACVETKGVQGVFKVFKCDLKHARFAGII